MSAARGGASTPAVRIADVRKAFGAVQANRAASLEVAAGEIHALVGENGAGKSTLMRMLAGLIPPDGGRIEVLGRDVTGWTTAEAIAAGVGMVHQHFMLVPTLTVAENMVLGVEPTAGVALDLAKASADVRAIAERTGLTVAPERKVADLSVGEAQRVEILKALHRGAKVLILDEPTAVLSPPEVRELWAVLRTLARSGASVVLITHKLDEVIEISDTVTVMRAGTTVARFATAGSTPADIARAMVGRDVVLAGRQGDAPMPRSDEGTLVVHELVVPGARTKRAVDGVSFSVRPGEVLGIAGVEGNGQTELIEAIAGLRAPTAGTIRFGGDDVTRADVRTRREKGLAHIPEDRHHRGLVLDYSIADNLILGVQHRFGGRGGLDTGRIAEHARKQVAAFDIRPGDASLPARALSGGNQQKIVIAREMGDEGAYKVLLAAQPTRGVDVGAIEFIHARIRQARDAGKAVLLVSADLGELLALSTRVAVMYGGRIAAVLDAADATPEALGPYMTGAAGRPSGAGAGTQTGART